MNQSFPVIFICRFRRRWCGGQTSTVGQKGRNGYIAASMLYQALFIAQNAGIFTVGLRETTGGKHSTVWRCCTRVEHGPKECDAPAIQESDLQDAVVKAIQKVLGGKDVFLSVLEENIREVLESESGEQIEEIDCRLEKLQQELLWLANGKKEYRDVADEIHKLREQRQDVLTQDAERDGRRQRIGEMRAFLEKQVNEPLVYDEQLVRRLGEKITVYDDRMTVEFKSGLEIEVEE